MDLKVAEFIQSLVERGWTSRDFAANHLHYAFSRISGIKEPSAEARYRRYWSSVAQISALLQEEDIFHVVLKSRRSYPYEDTNVDVFVREVDWPRARDVLCRDHWRMPSRAILFKQSLIEKEKIKLPARRDAFVPAHMYLSVSWRYQREVTFLDLEMIDQVPLVEEAPQLAAEWGGVVLPMACRAADILLHCAEIVFENYRLTLGEALYLRWLLENTPSAERERVTKLGAERGASLALQCVLSQVSDPFADASAPEYHPDAWPKNLPWRDLFAIWGERFRTQAHSGRPFSGLEEWFGYAAFASMYRVKRRLFQ